MSFDFTGKVIHKLEFYLSTGAYNAPTNTVIAKPYENNSHILQIVVYDSNGRVDFTNTQPRINVTMPDLTNYQASGFIHEGDMYILLNQVLLANVGTLICDVSTEGQLIFTQGGVTKKSMYITPTFHILVQPLAAEFLFDDMKVATPTQYLSVWQEDETIILYEATEGENTVHLEEPINNIIHNYATAGKYLIKFKGKSPLIIDWGDGVLQKITDGMFSGFSINNTADKIKYKEIFIGRNCQVGGNSFHGSAIERVTFADDWVYTSIGTQAFKGCMKLTDVIIPATVTAVGNSAFANCHLDRVVFKTESKIFFGNSIFANSDVVRVDVGNEDSFTDIVDIIKNDGGNVTFVTCKGNAEYLGELLYNGSEVVTFATLPPIPQGSYVEQTEEKNTLYGTDEYGGEKLYDAGGLPVRVRLEGNTEDEVWYYKLASFPRVAVGDGSSSNKSSIIITGRIGGFSGGSATYILGMIQNRGGEFGSFINLGKEDTGLERCKIQMFRNIEGKTDVYLVAHQYFVCDLTLYFVDANYTYDGIKSTDVPTGELKWDSFDTDNMLRLYNGSLYLNKMIELKNIDTGDTLKLQDGSIYLDKKVELSDKVYIEYNSVNETLDFNFR